MRRSLAALQGVPGVPPIQEGINPATWMLEVTSPGTEDRLGVDFAQVYANSAVCRYILEDFVCVRYAGHDGVSNGPLDVLHVGG